MANLPVAIEVAHLDGKGGTYWLPAKRTTESYPDSLRPGKNRFSYEITLAPPGWGGIPFGALGVDDEGKHWRRVEGGQS